MAKDTVYVVPYPGVTGEIFYRLGCDRDEIPKPHICLREAIEEAGYRFQIATAPFPLDSCAALLTLCNVEPWILEAASRLPKERCFFAVMEPPVVMPQFYDPIWTRTFGTIFTLFDDLVDNRTFYKFYHYQARDKRVPPIDFKDKQFCVSMWSELCSAHPQEIYSERIKAIRAFPPEEIDVFGYGWGGIPHRKGRLFEDKLKVLQRYKFTLCYENMKQTLGFITERIFDALYAGCVPVYWGADNIGDYVPKNCFIDRREFATHEAVYRFLKQMDRTTYESYLQAAADYLQSPQHEIYSVKGFSNSLVKQIKNKIKDCKESLLQF